MTSYTVTISEGTGGYVASGYLSSGYVVRQTTLTDTSARTYGAVRALSQTVTLTEAVKLGIGRFCSEAGTFVESMTRQVHAIREITGTSGGYTASGYVASGYLTGISGLITESLSRTRNVPRTLTEQINNTNAVARIYGAVRAIAQTVTPTHTLGRTYGAVRALTETGTFTEILARKVDAIRTITQSLTLSVLLAGFKGVAGQGGLRIFEVTAFVFKRISDTLVFKRSADTHS